jgi:outer membrane lipoprotein-sorting protein
LVPRRIFVIDQTDNEIITTFRNGEFISPEDQIFQLDYPEDAEIVDMRN